MQIHEITLVQEGFLDKVNDLKKAFGTPGAMTSSAKFNQIQQQGQSQRQTSDYVKKLAAEWLQTAKTMPAPTPAAAPAPAPKATPGQMPSSVAQSRQGQLMQQVYGKPTGGIQGMQSDLEEARVDPAKLATMKQRARVAPPTAPSSATTPTPTTPTSTAPVSNSVVQQFRQWVDKKMASTIPGTRQQLNMDMVRSQLPDIGLQLSSALSRVEQAPTDPAAIEAYITIAVQGIQRLSQQLKQQDPGLAKKATSYEIGPAQRNNNYVKTTKNPEADAALRAQGFVVQ